MSIRLMSAAWEMDLPQTEKMVLLCLCDHASDHGVCWPSVLGIARRCSVSDRTVQKAIKALRERGILTWEEASGRAHKFTIDPRSIFTPENASPPKMTTETPENASGAPENASDEPSITIKEPSEDTPPDGDEDFSCSDFEESWNAIAGECGLPPIRKMTNARRRAFEVRKREFPDIEDWKSALRCVQRTKWLHGDNPRGWRADADFFLQAKSFTKLVEGSYAQAD